MNRRSWSRRFILLAVLAVAGLAGSAHGQETEAPIADAVKSRLEEAQSVEPAVLQAVTEFYEVRGYGPLWVDGHALNVAGLAVTTELRRADDWGLKASDFDIPGIDTLTVGAGGAPLESLADAEIRISLSVLKYAQDARGGRIPEPAKQLSSYLDRRPQLLQPVDVLTQIANSPRPADYLAGLNPQHEQFQRLRKVYLSLRDEARRATAAPVSPRGPLLHPGQAHGDIAAVRKRLEVPALPGQEGVYDTGLAEAVRQFQRRKGLDPDGLIGQRTRRALNDGPGEQIDAVLANMEQWRWMPADLGDQYVLVNIPSFSIDLVRDGKTIFSERVIAGKVGAQTPVFSENMQTVVLHPRWYVPESIKLKELLPSLLRGRSLESLGFRLARNGREVDARRVDWSRADIREYAVYQIAGDDNALGQVKFLFPNKHAVYLHDTPTKRLFQSPVRLYSHGCVRVRNPLKLAQLLLGEDKRWDPAKVAALMEDGPFDNAIALDQPVPVHISYFTVRVDDTGKPRFMADVYGHEKRITLALAGRWNEIDKGEDHLAPVDMARIEAELRRSRRARAPRPRPATASAFWGAPMGLTTTGSSRSSGTTADDIFRRSFGR